MQCVLGHWAISAETPSWGIPNEDVGLAPWGTPETREVRLWKSVPGGKSWKGSRGSLWRVDVVPARHQNARLFAIGTILEIDLVDAF